MNNASELVVLVVYSFLLLVLLVFSAIAFAVVQKQRLSMRLQELEQKAQSERLKLKLEVQEETYRVVAREIHDNIGQMLGSASIILQTELSKSKDERSDQVFEASINRLSDAIGDIRQLCQRLSGTHVERLGLVSAIKRELAYLSSTQSLRTFFTYPPDKPMPQLSETQTLVLFRIAQEAIHNVLRHADAGMLCITIENDKNTGVLKMEIKDDGKGFDPTAVTTKGLGLATMRERARALGGSLHINTTALTGTIVSLSLKV